DLDVMASTEGAPIARVYGRARLAGQVIWATKLEEVISFRSDTEGGKGGPTATTNTTTYTNFANFAVGLCAGPIGRIGRIWAEGKPLDLVGLTVRTYTGSESQTPDPLIVALDDLQGTCPNLERVAIVVAWFGSDLRAAKCSLVPKVDSHLKITHPANWSVAGVSRAAAQTVSTFAGRPAFGGTPSDDGVIHL